MVQCYKSNFQFWSHVIRRIFAKNTKSQTSRQTERLWLRHWSGGATCGLSEWHFNLVVVSYLSYRSQHKSRCARILSNTYVIYEVSRTFRHGRSGFFAATQLPSGKQLLFLTHILAINIRIWIAFRKSQCHVCIKNVMNVPTRTFCFVAATQTPQGKKLFFSHAF